MFPSLNLGSLRKKVFSIMEIIRMKRSVKRPHKRK